MYHKDNKAIIRLKYIKYILEKSFKKWIKTLYKNLKYSNTIKLHTQKKIQNLCAKYYKAVKYTFFKKQKQKVKKAA